jgi:hypothetical protein
MIHPLSNRQPTTEDDQREIATEGGKDSHRLRTPRNEVFGKKSPTPPLPPSSSGSPAQVETNRPPAP